MEKTEKPTIHKIFWYFLIFSIIGIIIETLYCYITAGTIESRKGLIWGPFCPVYGISAAVLILVLYKYQNKNIVSLFFYGIIVGSVAEYLISYILETIYGMRFWDYGYAKVNLNGRICLQYSIYWGVLSVIILKLIKPVIDKLIKKIPTKPRNYIEIILLIYFILNCAFTVWGIQTYQNRVVYGIVNNKETNNPIIKLQQIIENNYFTNERMSKTFPNLRIKDKNNNEIWIKTLIQEE